MAVPQSEIKEAWEGMESGDKRTGQSKNENYCAQEENAYKSAEAIF